MPFLRLKILQKRTIQFKKKNEKKKIRFFQVNQCKLSFLQIYLLIRTVFQIRDGGAVG